MPQKKKWRLALSVTIGLAFGASIIPILLVMLSFSYRTQSRNLLDISNATAEANSRNTIAAVENLLEPVASTLRVAAGLAAADPGFFRRERSRDYLHAALTSAPQIDALYASFEDGYHRVVTRVDEDRRRFDPKIPKNANWHSSTMDAYKGTSKTRLRRRSFFESWPGPVIASYDYENSVDIRVLPHYARAKEILALAVGDPAINPDTGAPVVSQGYPVVSGGRFIGFIGANTTFSVISKHLAENRVSPASVSIIADEVGRVLAHPDPAKGVRKTPAGGLAFAELADFPDAPVREAFARRARTGLDKAVFTIGGAEYLASFSRFPESFGKKWEVLIVTPTDDFLGSLKAANRKLLLLLAALCLVEFVLILVISKRIADPINLVSEEMDRLRELSFKKVPKRASMIKEVAQLNQAVSLLQNSLASFSAFVPLGVVRQLVSTGKALARGVRSTELTILFTDLENFTTISEELAPEKLSEQLDEYFEETTGAVALEGGTIDKFVGDAVMAFWGAPVPIEEPDMRACRAALRIARRNKALNERWEKEGKPGMKVRVGIHRGKALVGNIGSSERLSYTAIGDSVNVASRLEGMNKEFGSSVCISEDVLERCGDALAVKPLGEVKVKGRTKPVKIYELLDIAGSEDPELRPSEPR